MNALLSVFLRRPTVFVSSGIVSLMHQDPRIDWTATVVIAWCLLLAEWNMFTVDCLMERGAEHVVLKPSARPKRLIRSLWIRRAAAVYGLALTSAALWYGGVL